jgi:2,5-dihydroxypyridine 5,6-dioxygenase
MNNGKIGIKTLMTAQGDPMLQERTEPAWIDAFETLLRRCALQPGDTVAILGETQSRPVLMELARLAAARVGARAFALTLPSVFSAGGPCRAPPGPAMRSSNWRR